MSVAIIVTVFRNPPRLAGLVDNMRWAGLPDIPLYVFEDPSPFEGEREEVSAQYQRVAADKGLRHFETAPDWGCMQGIIDFAFRRTTEDWLIYVPDDVIFSRGGLWNEYAGVLAYGREFVGCIQAPYWNAIDLVNMGVISHRELIFTDWAQIDIPLNPFWQQHSLPRTYINVNGAGFSMSRRLFEMMGGWPRCTWRLDEWAGYQAWVHDMVCITLPGPPRVHFFGGATPLEPKGLTYHTVEAWKQATGGLSPEETGNVSTLRMARMPNGLWPTVLTYFTEGSAPCA